MKISINFRSYLAIAAMIFLSSCFKDGNGYMPGVNNGSISPVITNDTLKGKEFLFDNLVWEIYYNERDNVDNVLISINNRPDLFLYPHDMEVLLMPDSSSGWVPVRKSTAELPYYGFLYHHHRYTIRGIDNYSFVIKPTPDDVALVGKIASVKVKF